MLALQMNSNVEDIIGMLSDLSARHIPFAMAKALTETAKEGAAEVKAEMPDRFALRSGWTQKGVRFRMARPGDPQASVYTMDWYMRTQEGGGARRPQSAAHLWIPTLAARAGGLLSNRVLSRYAPKNIKKSMEAERKGTRKRPGKGRYANPKAFIVERDGKRSVFIRQFPDRRLPIVKLFELAESVKLPPRWQFEKTMNRVTGKQLRKQFLNALDYALKTSKTPVDPTDRQVLEHLISGGDIGTGGMLSRPSTVQQLFENGAT